MNNIINYIVENQEIFIGLEDSKKTWKLCARSGGVVIHEASMPAKYEVLNNYFSNKFPGCLIHVMYEAGFRGFELHDQLKAAGYDCVVTPPHTVTEEKSQRKKNDRIDCRRLAKNLENGDYHSCYPPERKLREDRQISRLYEQGQRDIVRECNRIRRTLEFHGLDQLFPEKNWSRNQYRQVHERLNKMDIAPSLKFTFNAYFDKLEHLWEIQKQVLNELKALAQLEPYRRSVDIWKSAPGIGVLTAIRLALEWGDVRSRFVRKENFSSFLGMIPSEYSTGEQERKGPITKQGNRQVRAWLIECTWRALKYDPALLDKFNRVVKSTGSRKKAIVATARKLAIRLRAVLIQGTPYTIGLIK
jgi:transposase